MKLTPKKSIARKKGKLLQKSLSFKVAQVAGVSLGLVNASPRSSAFPKRIVIPDTEHSFLDDRLSWIVPYCILGIYLVKR